MWRRARVPRIELNRQDAKERQDGEINHEIDERNEKKNQGKLLCDLPFRHLKSLSSFSCVSWFNVFPLASLASLAVNLHRSK
jgi:hypothetical protein